MKRIDLVAMATFAILGTTCVSGSIMLGTSAFAGGNSSVDRVKFTVPEMCTMSSDTTSDHTSKIIGGINATNIGATTFSVTCNDTNGYAIYAIGYGNGEDGNTNLIAQSPLTATNNIATGLATSGNVSNWSMKLTAGNDGSEILNDYDDYNIVPETFTKVAVKESGINTDTSKTTFSSTYGVFASLEQPAGNYIGQVKYVMIHPSDGCISDDDEACAPIKYMQNVAEWRDELEIGDTVQAIDARDNKKYWVKKITTMESGKDSKIIMIQNLDLVLNENTLPLTSELSDVGNDGSPTPSTGWDPGETNYTEIAASFNEDDDGMHSWRLAGSLDPDVNYYYNSQSGYCNGYSLNAHTYADCDGKMFTTTKPTVDSKGNTIDEATAERYKTGIAYQWNTATAGTGDIAAESGSGSAKDSICPKGWYLESSWMDIANQYGLSVVGEMGNYFPSGSVREGHLSDDAEWWSSSGGNYMGKTATAYGNVENVTFYRYFGFAVRCTAR